MKTVLLARLALAAIVSSAGAAHAVVVKPPGNPTTPPSTPTPRYWYSTCFGLALIAQTPGTAPHYLSAGQPRAGGDSTRAFTSYDFDSWFRGFGSARPQYRNLTGLWARLELGIGTLNNSFAFTLRREDDPYGTFATGAVGYFGYPYSGNFDLGPYEDTSYNDYFQGTHNVCYSNTYGQPCRVFFLRLTKQTIGASDSQIDRMFLFSQPPAKEPAPVDFLVTDTLGLGGGCQATFFGQPLPPYLK